MAVKVITNLLRAVDGFVVFFTLGMVKTTLEHKFVASRLDRMLEKELEQANKVIEHFNQK